MPERCAAISVAGGQLNGNQYLTDVMDDDMKFETIEPSHGGLAASHNALKNTMVRNTPVATDFYHSRVNEGNPATLAKSRPQVCKQRLRHPLKKATVANEMRKCPSSDAAWENLHSFLK